MSALEASEAAAAELVKVTDAAATELLKVSHAAATELQDAADAHQEALRLSMAKTRSEGAARLELGMVVAQMLLARDEFEQSRQTQVAQNERAASLQLDKVLEEAQQMRRAMVQEMTSSRASPMYCSRDLKRACTVLL